MTFETVFCTQKGYRLSLSLQQGSIIMHLWVPLWEKLLRESFPLSTKSATTQWHFQSSLFRTFTFQKIYLQTTGVFLIWHRLWLRNILSYCAKLLARYWICTVHTVPILPSMCQHVQSMIDLKFNLFFSLFWFSSFVMCSHEFCDLLSYASTFKAGSLSTMHTLCTHTRWLL